MHIRIAEADAASSGLGDSAYKRRWEGIYLKNTTVYDRFKKTIDLRKCAQEYLNNNTEAGRMKFFMQMKAAEFLVPCSSDGKQLAVISNQKRELFLPAFTQQSEVKKENFPDATYTVLTFDQIHSVITDAPDVKGVVFDPYSLALPFQRSQLNEIQSATNGLSVEMMQHEKPLIIKPWKKPEPKLTKALNGFFEQSNCIYGAWLVSARSEENEKSHRLFVIDFDGDRRDLFPKIADIIKMHMECGESFELMKAEGDVMKSIEGRIMPFYMEKKF